MVAGIGLTYGLELPVATVADIAPVPAGLPPLTWAVAAGPRHPRPGGGGHHGAVPGGVEARCRAPWRPARASRWTSTPTSWGWGRRTSPRRCSAATPSRAACPDSGLNHSLGARTRLSGMLAGLWVLLVPLGIGPLIGYTPIATLAGTIMVVAVDLIDPVVIRGLLKSGPGDRLAFFATVLGTLVLAPGPGDLRRDQHLHRAVPAAGAAAGGPRDVGRCRPDAARGRGQRPAPRGVPLPGDPGAAHRGAAVLRIRQRAGARDHRAPGGPRGPGDRGAPQAGPRASTTPPAPC